MCHPTCPTETQRYPEGKILQKKPADAQQDSPGATREAACAEKKTEILQFLPLDTIQTGRCNLRFSFLAGVRARRPRSRPRHPELRPPLSEVSPSSQAGAFRAASTTPSVDQPRWDTLQRSIPGRERAKSPLFLRSGLAARGISDPPRGISDPPSLRTIRG